MYGEKIKALSLFKKFPIKMDRMIRINVRLKKELVRKARYTVAQSIQYDTTPILHQCSGKIPGKYP